MNLKTCLTYLGKVVYGLANRCMKHFCFKSHMHNQPRHYLMPSNYILVLWRNIKTKKNEGEN